MGESPHPPTQPSSTGIKKYIQVLEVEYGGKSSSTNPTIQHWNQENIFRFWQWNYGRG